MTDAPGTTFAPPVLVSRDIVAGLGSAPRDLVATCLALFDDSTLRRRIGTLMNRVISPRKDCAGPTNDEAATAVQGSMRAWRDSPLSDAALRLLLWIYLREAFSLPPLTFASMRSASSAADDMVACALNFLQPGAWTKGAEQLGLKKAKELPTTLDALARKTMEELMVSFLKAEDAQSKRAREELLAQTRERVSRLPPEDRARLMQSVGADDVNDAALRNILLTGGGLGAFGTSVSLAGFSAYIFAAQASAFIPLISGPTLVSMVAVLANPITIVAATAGVGWWASRSADQKVRGGVGVRVLSLLALNGLEAGAAGVRGMIEAFPSLGELRGQGRVSAHILVGYERDWRRIAPVRRKATGLDPAVANVLERPARGGAASDRLDAVVQARAYERRNTVALSGLTLGDILYNAFSIDPAVMRAADFSRVEDLGNPVAFASFAHRIEEMDPAAHLGAVSNLKGYVAERVVAAQLIAQGHVVEFPQASNQAGWDILVDGQKFQVKDVGDLSSLHRHFDQGHDYPVIVNAEVASQLAARDAEDLPEWADKVHFVEGYTNAVVEHVTLSSIDAGDDMLHPDVPLFTLVLSGIRNIGRLNRNEITGSQAIQEVLLDGGTRAGLAIAGKYVGASIGWLVLGPAGALVLGALTPIASQRQAGLLKGKLDEWVKDETYRCWEKQARCALSVLLDKAGEALQLKADLLKTRQPVKADAAAIRYLYWRTNDELCFLREAWSRLQVIREDDSSTVELLVARTTAWLSTSTLHPVAYQTELAELSRVFDRKPSVMARTGSVSRKFWERVSDTTTTATTPIGERWGWRGGKKSE